VAGSCKHSNTFVMCQLFKMRKSEALVHATKACNGHGAVAPDILNLCSGWRLVPDSTPGRITSGKIRRYPLNRAGARTGVDVSEQNKIFCLFP
jgi:hypothetical protein